MPEDRDYEVGYRKPPKTTRFKKGQSGNPKGRPKGSLNVDTTFQSLIEERVAATENGRRRSMSMMEVILKRLLAKAASGDLKAIPLVLALLARTGAREDLVKPSIEQDHLQMHATLLKMRAAFLEEQEQEEDQPGELT